LRTFRFENPTPRPPTAIKENNERDNQDEEGFQYQFQLIVSTEFASAGAQS